LKVSIITICYNAVEHIDETIRSVVIQEHKDIELIVVDGGSSDGTLDKIERYREVISHYVSEPDKGIYDAMNKGLALASGDVIGFVNAGDMIARYDVISSIVKAFETQRVDAIYGDAIMVDPDDIRVVKRFWKGGKFKREKFRKGWMPPHLGTYIRRSVYEKYGSFNTDLKVAADYELLLRFFYRYEVPVRYLKQVLVRFRLGGTSNASLKHIWKANKEVYEAWKINGLKVSPAIIIRKPLRKVKQYFNKS
jgi:glycosyltransferase involved in cell wall biosynthesis